MLSWSLALLAGVVVTVISYGSALREGRWLLRFAALLRGLAVALLLAAVLDAPLGFAGGQSPMVLLDASASWLRTNDTTAWRTAQAYLRENRRDSVIVFGDSVRGKDIPGVPADRSSRLQPALLRALGSGRAIVLITDGEIDDPPSILDALPGGSRIMVPERAPLPDAAVVSVDAPRYVTSGDSISVRVAIVAGHGGSAPGNIRLFLGERLLATVPSDSLGPLAEQVLVMQGFWDGNDNGPLLLRAIVNAPGDRESRNDSLSSAVEASTTPGVVFVSTSPDLDARFALSVLRGTLSLPTRAFLRVAPGNWRLEGPLTRVDEAEVRRSAANAPVVIIHGDTAIFGAPRDFTRGALALFSTVSDGGDWYPVGSPASPLSGALSGIPWDSLPPIEVSPRMPSGRWQALETRRARQAADRRMAIVGVDEPRRIAVIGASGLWRWAFKGGVAADAHAALWGSVFDWLVAERADDRNASPALQYYREGETIRWRRGTKADTLVTLAITARRAGAQADTVRLNFAASSNTAESPGLPAGIYDVVSEGGVSILVVNESLEMVPRRSLVASGAIEGSAPQGERRGSRRSAGVFIAVVLMLCTEWLLRRRMGLR